MNHPHNLKAFMRIENIPLAETFTCARRAEMGLTANSVFTMGGDNVDTWSHDVTCSFCGSMNPDLALFLSERGQLQWGPTDKSYKAYIEYVTGSHELVTKPDDYHDAPSSNDADFADKYRAWEKRKADYDGLAKTTFSGKLYFQHFTHDHITKFIELMNAKRLKIGYPGRFCVNPFFIVRKPKNP